MNRDQARAVAARLREIARQITINPHFDIEGVLEQLLVDLKPEPNPELTAMMNEWFLRGLRR